MDLMDDLYWIYKVRMDNGAWNIGQSLEKDKELMQEVELIPRPVKRKRGLSKSTAPKADKPKRPRGRPRTRPLPDPNAPKRKRGRPKGSKNKKNTSDAKQTESHA